VAAVLLLTLFVHLQRKVRQPMLDLGLFRHPLFSASVVSALLNYTCTAMITFLMPFYLIKGLGWTPSKAGLILTIQPLLMAVTAPLSGTVSDRLGHSRLPAILGMAILAVGAAWLAQLQTNSSWLHTAVGLGIVGLGTGMFISPNNSALMGSAPRNRQGIAAGMMATARNVGMVLGVGVAGAIVTTMMVSRPSGRLLEAVTTAFWVSSACATFGFFTSMIRSKSTS
jgi:MFS family permease